VRKCILIFYFVLLLLEDLFWNCVTIWAKNLRRKTSDVFWLNIIH